MMNCCSSLPRISAPASTQTPPTSSDILSIRQIARLYAGEQIIVSPITWTGRHIELLRCSFTDPIFLSSNTELKFPPEHDGHAYVKGYLRSWMKYTYRQKSLQRLLTAPECPLRSRPSVALRFDRISKKLPCTLFYYQGEGNALMVPEQPVAAYTDLGELENMRKDTLRCYKATRHNPLCDTIWQNRWKRLNPPQPLHDPYIIALLIAVAQEKQNHLYKANFMPEPHPKFFSSQVLCSFKSKEYLHLYTANISSSLLDMFDNSSVSPPAPISIPIQIRAIPILPEHTLRARLLGLLCPSYLPKKAKRNLDDKTPNLSRPMKVGRFDP
ncbi:hypothetical protein V8C37DRAFT_375800, partial [Trichoderma ceciliae]